MPRQRNAIPSRRINLHLREDICARLELFLYSELEQRIPEGAYKAFFEERVLEFFNSKRLDLAPWADTQPGAIWVAGSPESVRVLEKTLVELSLEQSNG